MSLPGILSPGNCKIERKGRNSKKVEKQIKEKEKELADKEVALKAKQETVEKEKAGRKIGKIFNERKARKKESLGADRKTTRVRKHYSQGAVS